MIWYNMLRGVEARELSRGAAGLEDAKVTRPDHPLVKYAEAIIISIITAAVIIVIDSLFVS